MIELKKNDKIFIAGHTGLVGSAIVRKLVERGYNNLVFKSHEELDLTNQKEVMLFFHREKPEVVIDAAGLVGGINANNTYPAEFFYKNMQMENNLIWCSHIYKVKKFVFLGSACMYPKNCNQPMKESELLTGLPEETNEGYALAKCCGSRLCSYLYKQYNEDFITVIPSNTFGKGDSFDPLHSHVVPALIKKIVDAKLQNKNAIEMWGTGKAIREFIFVDDLADGVIFLMEKYSDFEPINLGTGEEVSMYDLAKKITNIVGYSGQIILDDSKPDGMKRRIVDSSKVRKLGWFPFYDLDKGLKEMYYLYLDSIGKTGNE